MLVIGSDFLNQAGMGELPWAMMGSGMMHPPGAPNPHRSPL